MERRFEDLNIEAVGSVADALETYMVYQKKCYHCGESFLSRKSNTMGCSHDHANSVRRHVKRNGQPKLVFKLKLADKVDFSLKKYDEPMGAKKTNLDDDNKRMAQVLNIRKLVKEEEAKMDAKGSPALGMASPTWEHARIMRNVVINCYNRHKNKFEALPELSPFPSKNKAPRADVGFVANGVFEVAFEVMKRKQFGKTKTQTKIAGYTYDFNIKEVIIYIYDLKEWHVWNGNGFIESSKSSILGIDLADYIDLPK